MGLTHSEQLELESLQTRFREYMSKDWLTDSERQGYDRVMSRMDELNRRSGNPLPNNPPYDPPPPPPNPLISPTSHGRGHDFPPSESINKEPPVPGQTEFLPLTGNATYDATIKDVDAALSKINRSAFNLHTDDLWHYDGAQLGGVTGPSNISNLNSAVAKTAAVHVHAGEAFSDITRTMESVPSGTWTDRMREMYRPFMKVAGDGAAPGGLLDVSRTRLISAGEGPPATFAAFHTAITASRDAIEELYGTDEFGNRYLDTTRSLHLDSSVVDDARNSLHELDHLNSTLKTSLDGWNIPTVSGTGSTSGGEAAGGYSDGGGFPPSDTTMSGTSASPSAQIPGGMPGGGMPGGMPQMPQMPSPASFVPPGAFDNIMHPPNPEETQLSADSSGDGGSALKSDDGIPKTDVKPADKSDASSAGMHGMSAAAIPRPGDPVRPGALGADGKPLDKDGDGLMDDDAIAATKENMDRDGDGHPDVIPITVDTPDRSVDVELKDPRVAEMIQRLSGGTEGDPVKVLDAAAQTGLDLPDYGERIDTLAIQPGDVVTGTDTGMYLGKGMVLTESGSIRDLASVMDFAKSDPGVYRMVLPDLPSSGEVLPPTEAATILTSDTTSHVETPMSYSAPVSEASVPHTEHAANSVPVQNTSYAESPVTSTASPTAMPMKGVDGIEEVPFEGYELGN